MSINVRQVDHGKVVWFIGLSGAGKTTLCSEVKRILEAAGSQVAVVDGDEMRKGLCVNLGYSIDDRLESIRRIAHCANAIAAQGLLVLVAVIAPTSASRAIAKRITPSALEVFVDAPLHICETRDPKGLYKRARQGELTQFTGITSPFEPPVDSHLVCKTDREDLGQSARKVIRLLEYYEFIQPVHLYPQYGACELPERLR